MENPIFKNKLGCNGLTMLYCPTCGVIMPIIKAENNDTKWINCDKCKTTHLVKIVKGKMVLNGCLTETIKKKETKWKAWLNNSLNRISWRKKNS